jgi:hypothetical protein
MQLKIDTPYGKEIYGQRIGNVEPVFGNIRYNKIRYRSVATFTTILSKPQTQANVSYLCWTRAVWPKIVILRIAFVV